MKELIHKAQTLVEALPYIREFYGKTIVVKYGGSITGTDLTNFARDIVLMKYVGMHPVVVHGGGPQIGSLLDRLGISSRFVAGLRVTDSETMEIVEMVLVGKVNQEIITAINALGGNAVGASGKEGKIIIARKMDVSKFARENEIDIPEDTDLGMVGEVERINPHLIKVLEDAGFIPVIAPIGFDEQGRSYNINADHVAGKIAGALQAEKLIILTDVPGILDEENRLISSLTEASARDLIRRKVISKGMIPKVMCAIEALREGVHKVHIIDGRVEHSLILEIFTDAGVGTEIVL
ncbi:MAG: acetylglutamate kinase [Deltaproteobacteria bacterium]|jgi:acetylglutamate kinase|nr:MAG: acetylglutamate kinase [Deltaproteobacteria bacterium]